jgi:NAD+ kinase
MTYTTITRDKDKSLEIINYIKSKLTIKEDEANPDYVIAVGGDGTIINAVHKYPSSIIFGIHTGHLGFYANYDQNDVDILINDINNNEFKTISLGVVCASFNHNGKEVYDYALNEVTLVSPLRTLILNVSIDNEFLERYRGTGICVSTPTGSTAYNKSLHGSVIDDRLEVMQLTEMASINSTSYRTLSSSILLSKDRTISLTDISKGKKFITIDNIFYEVDEISKLDIKFEPNKIKMAYHNKNSFIDRISRTFLISKE